VWAGPRGSARRRAGVGGRHLQVERGDVRPVLARQPYVVASRNEAPPLVVDGEFGGHLARRVQAFRGVPRPQWPEHRRGGEGDHPGREQRRVEEIVVIGEQVDDAAGRAARTVAPAISLQQRRGGRNVATIATIIPGATRKPVISVPPVREPFGRCPSSDPGGEMRGRPESR
jgi:hypothetical protein